LRSPGFCVFKVEPNLLISDRKSMKSLSDLKLLDDFTIYRSDGTPKLKPGDKLLVMINSESEVVGVRKSSGLL
jgi:hypothetical protein